MHKLHAILVLNEDAIKNLHLTSIVDVKNVIKKYAINKTSEYGDWKVFNWRITEDCGKWKNIFPDNVILGSESPDILIKIIAAFKEIPQRIAKRYLINSRTIGTKITDSILDTSYTNTSNIELELLIRSLRIAHGIYTIESQFYNTNSNNSLLSKDEWYSITNNPEMYSVVLFHYHL